MDDNDEIVNENDSNTSDSAYENSESDENESEDLFTLASDAQDGETLVGGVVKGRHILTPGELVTSDTTWMRGHGTYSIGNSTYSSVAGSILRVNKLLSVTPLRGRYVPAVGDYVIGRIVEVNARSWRVDIGAKQSAVLMLGSVNLPGGVLRRKSENDELQMRLLLKEGDLFNAEVQSIYADGAAALHTRSLSYGKLRNGYFLAIPSSLVIKSKNHVFELAGGVDILMGVNGFIWIRKHTPPLGAQGVSVSRMAEEAGWEIYSDENDYISPSIRLTIARYANAIKALGYAEVGMNEARIVAAYEASTEFKSSGEMVENRVKNKIAKQALFSMST
ncbi:uncharacterized protein V1516DRAFT_629789 [Lipomyces oligophaga]|uniref:uncharacterized protein n=1 Tax=Lipomyces oligophaga TaxID=45792 RepID=UPI0034CD8CAF